MNYEYSTDYKMAYNGADDNISRQLKPSGIEWIQKKIESSAPPSGRGISRLLKPVNFLSRLNWIIFLVFLVSVVGFRVFWINRLPDVRSSHELRNFSEDRVRNFLEQLVKEPDVDLSLFLDKLGLISSITERHYVNNFELFIHNTSSCIGTDEECLRRSGNIAALISSKTQAPANVILISCEFGLHEGFLDEYSPIPCGMLMDAMQTIIMSNLSFVNDIIFSYNIRGEKYSNEPYYYLLRNYRVNAFIRLTGSAGRELLYANDRVDMLVEYMNNVVYQPSNMLVSGFLKNYLDIGIADNMTDSDYIDSPLLGLDIHYPKIYDKVQDFIKYKKSGSVQRVGENLLSFIFALSGSPNFLLRKGRILRFNYNITDEYYGFPFLRFHVYDFSTIFHLITLFLFELFVIITTALSYIYTCWHRRHKPERLLITYLGCLGSVIGMNAVLYFFSGLFGYIPIQWNHGTSFLRNLFLHFLLTISMYFKLTESIAISLSIDYEQIYFTFGVFSPMLILSLFINNFLSKAWGYYLIIVTVPLLLNTAIFRRIIFGVGIALTSPKIVMALQFVCLLPAIIFTTDIVDTYFRAIEKGYGDNYKIYAAVFGFFSAFLISNLTMISKNIVFDWGSSEYIPVNDCLWLRQPKMPEPTAEPYWQYS